MSTNRRGFSIENSAVGIMKPYQSFVSLLIRCKCALKPIEKSSLDVSGGDFMEHHTLRRNILVCMRCLRRQLCAAKQFVSKVPAQRSAWRNQICTIHRFETEHILTIRCNTICNLTKFFRNRFCFSVTHWHFAAVSYSLYKKIDEENRCDMNTVGSSIPLQTIGEPTSVTPSAPPSYEEACKV